MPQDFVAHAILETVAALPGFPGLRVLDLSCGQGEILRPLQAAGCTVRGTHYRGDDYKLEGAPETAVAGLAIDEDVDLLRRLPYEDGSFDLVILSEVVEHLQSYAPVLLEVGRVLAPGGHLVLTTPNLSRLHSRLHFLLTGTHKLIRRRVGWDLAPDDLYAFHISPVDFPFFHTLLHQAGLRLERLGFTRFKPRHAWLLLLYPVVWLAVTLEFARKRGNDARRAGERELRSWLLHPALLASEQLLVVARKRRD